jgi:mannose-1-phosphate guanylyltransferase
MEQKMTVAIKDPAPFHPLPNVFGRKRRTDSHYRGLFCYDEAMKTVILAAGFGSRLWPLSTSERPKQFQPLIEGRSPLAYTYMQVAKTIPVSELYVLGLEGMQELIQTELPDLDPSKIIVVPERRNTLPHTLWALAAITDSADEPVLFKSVDHFIVNPEAFSTSLAQAIAQYDVSKHRFTLLCTAYKTYDRNDGYCIADASGKIREFLEKPSEATPTALGNKAAMYRSPLIYITSKRAFLDVLDELETSWSNGAKQLITSGAPERQELFLDLPFLDISSAIFQASRQLWVREIAYDYIDVGQFTEIYALNNKDAQGNVINGNVILGTECRNCLIINKLPLPLVIMSLTDTVIVQTAAGSLVSPFKDASQVGDIYKKRIQGQ